MTFKTLQWFPWNGSKRWLLKDLQPIFSKWTARGRYIDPFVGGGSVSFLLRQMFPTIPHILSDANPWLISCFEAQIKGLMSLGVDLSAWSLPDIEYYRNLCDVDLPFLSLEDRATRFAVCLFTAWGNRWETYDDGRFRSTKNLKYCEPEFLEKKLKDFLSIRWLSDKDSVQIADWKDVVSSARPGDLVYIDPPYPESLGYGNQWWSFSDQLDVVDWTLKAKDRGINVVVSNMSTLERLYRRGGMNIQIVQGPSSMKTRRVREEVIAWSLS